MRKLIGGAAFAVCLSQVPPALAATPQELLHEYESEARKQSASFKASASRGESFFRSEHAATKGGKQGCFSCHTSDPRQAGTTRANKSIGPLAPAVNPARLTDPAKVEKWFGRNCEDVLVRACSAAEKADFIQWLINIR